MDRPALREQIGTFLHTRLADIVDLLAVGVLAVVISVAALGHSLLVVDHVLAASIVAPAVCYLLTSRALRRCERVGPERIFMASAAMVAGMWLFETLSWAGWSSSWGQVKPSLAHFNVNIPHAGGIFPLLWAAIMVGVMFVGAPNMRVNRLFVIVFAVAVAVLALWLAVGYPSHHQPSRSPNATEILQLIPPGYAHPQSSTDPGWAFIVLWGSVFTSAAKILWGVLPALLFVHHFRDGGSASGQQRDDLLARVRRALMARLIGGRSEPSPPAKAPLGTDAAAIPSAGVRGQMAARTRAVVPYLEPRIADVADLAMVAVIFGVIVLAILRGSFIAVPPQLLAASVIAYALAYLVTSRALRARKELGARRVFISLCALASSVWLFETIWWFWGFDVWYKAPSALFTLSLDTTAQPFPLTWAIIVVSLAGAGWRYMGPNRWILVVFAIAVITFEIWKAAGWPLFPRPQTWPEDPPRLWVIPASFAHPDTPAEQAVVVFWGGLLNSITKIFWCMLPATFFLTRENLGKDFRQRILRPLPALKRLLMPWTDWATAIEEGGPAPSGARPKGS